MSEPTMNFKPTSLNPQSISYIRESQFDIIVVNMIAELAIISLYKRALDDPNNDKDEIRKKIEKLTDELFNSFFKNKLLDAIKKSQYQNTFYSLFSHLIFLITGRGTKLGEKEVQKHLFGLEFSQALYSFPTHNVMMDVYVKILFETMKKGFFTSLKEDDSKNTLFSALRYIFPSRVLHFIVDDYCKLQKEFGLDNELDFVKK